MSIRPMTIFKIISILYETFVVNVIKIWQRVQKLYKLFYYFSNLSVNNNTLFLRYLIIFFFCYFEPIFVFLKCQIIFLVANDVCNRCTKISTVTSSVNSCKRPCHVRYYSRATDRSTLTYFRFEFIFFFYEDKPYARKHDMLIGRKRLQALTLKSITFNR